MTESKGFIEKDVWTQDKGKIACTRVSRASKRPHLPRHEKGQ